MNIGKNNKKSEGRLQIAQPAKKPTQAKYFCFFCPKNNKNNDMLINNTLGPCCHNPRLATVQILVAKPKISAINKEVLGLKIWLSAKYIKTTAKEAIRELVIFENNFVCAVISKPNRSAK